MEELEEKLIDFETAKLAKEKGFDIHCRWHFDDENGDLYENEDFPYNSWNDSLFAPTQEFLKKWLISNHNIIISVISVPSEGYISEGMAKTHKPSIEIIKSIGKNIFTSELKYEMFHGLLPMSYEEAFELGLVESLKLIK